MRAPDEKNFSFKVLLTICIANVPRFAAACRGDDVILVVNGAATEEGPGRVLQRHHERELRHGMISCV